ncbi:hypothetical protein BKA69DRAFT_1065482 [Paraphysoderma sedebokerense]|nr:hypothetical protein BKA69DRAFT_1065482 [Paraphysoderma sedebokerense]
MNQQHPSGQTKDESIEKENRSWRNERTDRSKDLRNSLNSTEANKTDVVPQSSNLKGRGHPRFRQNNPDSIDSSTSWDAGPRPPQDSRNSRRTTSSDDRPSEQQFYSNSNSRSDMMSQNRRGGGYRCGLHNRIYDSQSASSDARHQFGPPPQRTTTTEDRKFKKEPSSLQASTDPSTGDRISSSQSSSSDTRRSSGRGRVSIFAKGLVMKHLHHQPGLKANEKSNSMKNESIERQDLPGERKANSAVQEGLKPDEEDTKHADSGNSISQAQQEENMPSDSDTTLEPDGSVQNKSKSVCTLCLPGFTTSQRATSCS